MDQIPKKVPYLHAPAASVEKFRQLMEPADGKFKIGLVWAGRAHPPGRSVELSAFAPFAQIPGTAFVSLQFGAPANQVENAPAGMQIIHFTEELKDFTDTAAVLENLDLLITIDTAAGHLAGAMAKPVWVLLPWMPDWRWLMDRKDSPWYPTMRLYRQPIRGDFATPIDHITKDLRALLAAKDPAIE